MNTETVRWALDIVLEAQSVAGAGSFDGDASSEELEVLHAAASKFGTHVSSSYYDLGRGTYETHRRYEFSVKRHCNSCTCGEIATLTIAVAPPPSDELDFDRD